MKNWRQIIFHESSKKEIDLALKLKKEYFNLTKDENGK